MSRETHERAAYLAALIARHTTLPPRQIAAHVTYLQRLAKQAATIEVNLCNVPGYRPTYERRAAQLLERGNRIAAEFSKAGCGHSWCVEVGGDARGPCFHLKIPGERGDGMDPESGFAVY